MRLKRSLGVIYVTFVKIIFRQNLCSSKNFVFVKKFFVKNCFVVPFDETFFDEKHFEEHFFDEDTQSLMENNVPLEISLNSGVILRRCKITSVCGSYKQMSHVFMSCFKYSVPNTPF